MMIKIINGKGIASLTLDDADSLVKQSDFDGAIALYEKALSYKGINDSLRARANRGLASVNQGKGDIDKVIANLTSAINASIENYSTCGCEYYQRGTLYENKGNIEQAIDDYKDAADFFEKKALDKLKELGIIYEPLTEKDFAKFIQLKKQGKKGTTLSSSTASSSTSLSPQPQKHSPAQTSSETNDTYTPQYFTANEMEKFNLTVGLCKDAEQGKAEAQYEIATRTFIFGLSGAESISNNAKPIEWCRKAAEQGYIKAQIELGWRYRDGEGVPKDKAKAIEWYSKAVDQGDSNAQKELKKTKRIFWRFIWITKKIPLK